MGLSFDFYNRLKQSKMFLANPQKTYIGTVTNAQNVKLKQILNNLYELEFVIYEKLNGEFTENYDKYTKPRLIEVQNVGWFQIVNAVEKFDDSVQETYKTIKCLKLENTLIYRKIYDIVGTFSLYDISDQEHSLLHIIANEVKWGIGHISNSLLGKFRTFDIDSMEIYNLLTTTVSESFGCLITFNSYNKLINAYTIDEIGEDTNIVISRQNILHEWEKNDSDSIVTKIRVYGGDDGSGGNVSIRSVNFGLDYLVNFDYFMSEDWVSNDLINSFNSYKLALASVESSYNTNIENLKTKMAELTVLETELKDLTALQSAQSQIMGSSVQSHGRVPIPSDSDYTIYQSAVTAYNSYVTQIANKNTQITTKENEITAIENILDSIGESVAIENYLSAEQLSELDLFISEGSDFSDETYVQTDEMTDQEVIDMKLELKQNAANELAKISQPRYQITIKASSLYTIQNEKDSLVPYSEWIEKFQLGNKILIKLRKNYSIIARLMSISIDFDNPSDIELTFSNKDKIEDSLTELAEILADSGRTANAYTLKSFGYDKASKQTSSVIEFMTGSLNATLNSMKSNDNQELLIDGYGLKMRKWDVNTNSYSPYQAWWNQSTLLFTSDAWVSAATAIGLLTAPDNTTYWGINTQVLVGTLLLGTKLNITNSSGSYTIDNAGFTSQSTIGVNTYSVKINPSSPSSIFSVNVNSVAKMYIDVNTNQLVMSGVINADSGTLNNLTVLGTLSGGTISGSTISGSTISGGNINGSYISGGTINGSTITSYAYPYKTAIDGGYITTNLLYVRGVTSSGEFTTNSSPYASINAVQLILFKDSLVSFGAYSDGSVICSKINGGVPITSLNMPSIPSSTNQIYASDTGYGNLDFLGFDNAAGVNYVQANYVRIDPSDIRLKYDIHNLDDMPDDLFYSLKPKRFKYKTNVYGNGVFFGLIAQEVESAFQFYGLNPYDYDLIEVKDVKAYTDDGYYVNDATHRIHYNNLISWMINIIQKQNQRILALENH